MNLKPTLWLILLSLVLPCKHLLAQDDLEKKVATLTEKVEDLTYALDKILKQTEDNLWHQSLADIAFVDKVRMTGPPAKTPSGTAKGAGNPLVFWSYVFLPKKANFKGKVPLIVLVHGGVHGNLGFGNVHIVREFLAQGYAVVAPEYRGSTGYGKSFQRKIDYGGKEIEDTRASRDFMVENYPFIDGKRVGVVGWSHGGLHALMNVFDYPDSYAVAFAGVPVSDLIMRMGLASDSYRKLFSANYHIGKEVYQNVKEYRRRSPAFNAHKLKTPLLIYANTSDDDVLIEEVEHLISSLKANKKNFEYKIFENEPGGHHFDRIDTRLARETRLTMHQFLAKYLKPAKPFTSIGQLNATSYHFEE